ncbi:hypothetical protein [Pedobacter miscanthi]|uniref:DUF7336 domain-containing protein n=1 Tax=Pedobacter miscanthi TaxID=2259170 RepID=UPI00292EB002|nr:hypothetical protein [Pedobacter miscanthi]
MGLVYLLWHTHYDNRLENNEDIKLIGVYSTEDMAKEAECRAKLLEGFKDSQDGFEISSYRLDKDEWTSGFVTV